MSIERRITLDRAPVSLYPLRLEFGNSTFSDGYEIQTTELILSTNFSERLKVSFEMLPNPAVTFIRPEPIHLTQYLPQAAVLTIQGNYGGVRTDLVFKIKFESYRWNYQLYSEVNCSVIFKPSVKLCPDFILLRTSDGSLKSLPELENEGKLSLDDLKYQAEQDMKRPPERRRGFLKFLGKGSFGVVARGVLGHANVAVKLVNEDTDRECQMMETLRCPFCVEFMGSTQCNDKKIIVMELAPYGSLTGVLRKEISMYFRVRALYDIVRAIAYMHGRGYIHRDIKSQNALVFSMDAANTDLSVPIVKVTDFGTARAVPTIDFTMTGFQGSAPFMAPEILEGKTDYTLAVDIFSIGRLIWEVFSTGDLNTELNVIIRREYTNPDMVHPVLFMLNVIKKNWLPFNLVEDTPQDIIRYYKKCTMVDPKDRPDAVELVGLFKVFCETLPH